MYSRNREAVKQHIETVRQKALSVSDRNRQIIDRFIACYIYSDHSRYFELRSTLWPDDCQSMAQIFAGSEYQVLEILFGIEWAEKFKKIWDRNTDYIYSSGWGRRSFRAKGSEQLYLSNAVHQLEAMFSWVADGCSYERYLSEKGDAYPYLSVISELLALEIDEGNALIINHLHDAVYGENSAALISREKVRGLLMSHSPTAHRWVGDLLLAARLQEGVRQVIVENMDEGSREGFLYLLRLIIEHDLVRFSSVVRALDTWTGLGIVAQKPAVVKKCFNAVYRCLTEREYLQQCLAGGDVLLIYMGLWTIAFDDILAVESELQRLLVKPEKYKRLVALSFLSETQFSTLQHKLALPLLDDPDYEVKCWALVNILPDTNSFSLRNQTTTLEEYKVREITEICDFTQLYNKLRNILDHMPQREIAFKGSVFPWSEAAISYDALLIKILLVIKNDPKPEIIDLLLDDREKMSPNTREVFLAVFLPNPKTRKQKAAIVEWMGDRSPSVRAEVTKIVQTLTLSAEDYRMIEDLLKSKAGDLRKNAISVLLRQSPGDLLAGLKRLFSSNSEQKMLAALEMVGAVEKDPAFLSIRQECYDLAVAFLARSGQSEISQKAREMAERITGKIQPQYTAANGFGLYNPQKASPLPKLSPVHGFSPRSVLSSAPDEIQRILQSFSDRIHQHKDYEYEAESWDGLREKVVLGGEAFLRSIKSHRWRGPALTLDDYPLAGVWRKTQHENNLTAQKLLEALFHVHYLVNSLHSSRSELYAQMISTLFEIDTLAWCKNLKDLPYLDHVHTILQLLVDECPKPEVFRLCSDISRHIVCSIPSECYLEEYKMAGIDTRLEVSYKDFLSSTIELEFWLNHLRQAITDDASFSAYFQLCYALYAESDYLFQRQLQLNDFEKAFTLGLLDENEVLIEFCGRPLSPANIRAFTSVSNHSVACPKLSALCQKVVDRVISIELKRGEMPTEVSRLAACIERCTGTGYFVEILIGVEKEPYVRGYNFVGGDSTKKQIFSHLLRCCYPADGEDENTLRELLRGRKVTDQQLIDAAMYAPQWAELVEKYLNWPGLKSACWYFHAHVNELFSPEKERVVAKFSPLSPEEFKRGAFDINWFWEAYTTLGQDRFKAVYDSAKYIAGGGLHKRAQMFSDAVLGKMELNQAETAIREKRNKDYVLCYGLIPLKTEKRELLHRYEFLQAFLKESKQFGAQRRESESKTVAIALENLARNAGFSDVIRFTWYVETEAIRAMAPYLRPVVIDDTEVHIEVDELGKASVAVSKAGRARRDLPSVLKDHPYIKEIKSALKLLRNQHTRALITLEKAMESGDEFTADELYNLTENPVISPLIENLIFLCDNKTGYFRDHALMDLCGRRYDLQPEERCIIAHPVHLYECGEWAAYQRDLYERRAMQPFKQVFRELYRPNMDELALRTVSRRYAGYQIQPQKAAALLKGRGWTADYYEGLQKVYHQEKIIAQIYARADWFSPGDVEAPTIEEVQFYDRGTGKPIAFIDLPKVIFSEVMRDLDLVVSVAHAGGVDPEASLSTVEMRTALIEEMLRLLKRTNVQLKGSHAFIRGTLGEYTVHLGSGVVHKMATGAINILSVYSQHRGRIFLPFVDDDPRTAEIISKIMFLAEDEKIKDPSILEQIIDPSLL